MRRKEPRIDETFGPCVLYLEDIEEMLNALGRHDHVTFDTDKYEYDTFAELGTSDEQVSKTITIFNQTTNVAIQIRGSHSHITAPDQSPRNVGTCSLLEDIVRRRGRTEWWRVSPPALLGTVAGGLAGIVVIPKYWPPTPSAPFEPTLVFMIIGMFSLIILLAIAGTLMFLQLRRIMALIYGEQDRSLIYLVPRPASSSIWKRKRDEIVTGVVVAIVSAVATGIVTYLATRAGSPPTTP